jgi:hypothetical protein
MQRLWALLGVRQKRAFNQNSPALLGVFRRLDKTLHFYTSWPFYFAHLCVIGRFWAFEITNKQPFLAFLGVRSKKKQPFLALLGVCGRSQQKKQPILALLGVIGRSPAFFRRYWACLIYAYKRRNMQTPKNAQ